MPLAIAFVVAIVAVAAGTIGYFLGVSAGDKRPGEAAEIAERDEFIEHLRELAWQHRDISPELSTILIDEVSARHRKQMPPSS
ncbi:MAG: hypothetical protein V9G04_14650 [Nocardioides sp.]|jgi:hypothetical protein